MKCNKSISLRCVNQPKHTFDGEVGQTQANPLVRLRIRSVEPVRRKNRCTHNVVLSATTACLSTLKEARSDCRGLSGLL